MTRQMHYCQMITCADDVIVMHMMIVACRERSRTDSAVINEGNDIGLWQRVTRLRIELIRRDKDH